MANNTENVTVKTEFVDVITEGELVSFPVSATFSTIITEASLVKTPSDDIWLMGKLLPPYTTKCLSTPSLIEHSLKTNYDHGETPWNTNISTPCTPIINHWSTPYGKFINKPSNCWKKQTYLQEGTTSYNKKSSPTYQKSPELNYNRGCTSQRIFISKTCHLLPPLVKIHRLLKTVLLGLLHPVLESKLHAEHTPYVSLEQGSQWDATSVTVSHTLNGTVNYMFAHYVDKDSPDMRKRTALLYDMTIGSEDILL